LISNVDDIRNQIITFLNKKDLPKYDNFVELCNEATSILETEDSSYRPADLSNSPGGLLDFDSDKYNNVPIIVVPDLHARGYFLLDILNYRLKNIDETKTILELLNEGKLIICCVGDIFHSEGRARERWADAYSDFCAYYYDGSDISRFVDSSAMKKEMCENFSLLQTIFLLKKTFPENFHVLKGNHENIKNENYSSGENLNYGNRAFRKFCEEGTMCAEFIRCYYDDLLLHYISCFERALPICALFKNCVVSHAEPVKAFSRDEIINSSNNDDVIFGLTWTANDVAERDSVEKTMKNLYKKTLLDVFSNPTKKSVWIGGHRPILDKYSLRQNGLYIQIHNPEKEYISFVDSNRRFCPDNDIFDVESVF